MSKKNTTGKQKYTVDIYFDPRDGNEPVPWDSISKEKQAEILKKMSANLSSSMSRYYQNHQEAFERL